MSGQRQVRSGQVWSGQLKDGSVLVRSRQVRRSQRHVMEGQNMVRSGQLR